MTSKNFRDCHIVRVIERVSPDLTNMIDLYIFLRVKGLSGDSKDIGQLLGQLSAVLHS